MTVPDSSIPIAVKKVPRILRVLQFWLFLLYCTYLSLTPSPHEVLIESFSDKFLHFTGYLLLLVSLDLAYRPQRSLPIKIAVLLGYSLLIECAQSLISNRSFSIGDLFANLTGLLTAWLLMVVLRAYRLRGQHPG